MTKNTSEVEKSIENEIKGTPRGHQANVTCFPGVPETEPKAVRAAKSSVDYWKTRVRPRTLKDGRITPELYLRLKECGRDAWFSLATANRADAARKARDIWQSVQVKGLDAVLAELRPTTRAARVCSVAEFLPAAKAVATARPRSVAEYEASLRRVVAGVRGIKAKSDKHTDRADWHAKIDAVRLDQITPADVRAWIKEELAHAAKKGEDSKERREHTLASHIRDARALFSGEIVAEVKKKLVLPPELPFAGIPAAATTRRFRSKVDPRKLYTASAALDSDTRTALDLLLCGGLRRGEADLLPWAHIDLAAGTVRVDVTEYFTPKSKESYRTVPLPRDVIARLKARRRAAPSDVFVLSGSKPKPPAERGYEYRANAWDKLPAWLRKQGLVDHTPLHALRKLSGSFIYATAGLEAARQHLGHRDITTTARSYLQSSTATVDFRARRKGGTK